VEEQALERRPAGPGRGPVATSRPVDRIAGDGVADRVEMDPDLVRPPGHEVELESVQPANRSRTR
jgi:hypothetical protein